MAIPTADAALVSYSANFATRLTAAPLDFAQTAGTAAAYQALHDQYVLDYNAWAEARDAGNRSKSLSTAKRESKAALLELGREIYGAIQVSSAVSNTNKDLIGVRVIDRNPTPIPRPSFAPGLAIESVFGRTINGRAYDPAFPLRRRRPDGVHAVSIFTYVGETPPAGMDAAGWNFAGTVNRLDFQVVLPTSVAAGAKVWVTCCFLNFSSESGPACEPVSLFVQYGGEMQAA